MMEEIDRLLDMGFKPEVIPWVLRLPEEKRANLLAVIKRGLARKNGR